MIEAHADFLESAVGRYEGAETRFGDGVGDMEECDGAGGDRGGEGGIAVAGEGVGVEEGVWRMGLRVRGGG